MTTSRMIYDCLLTCENCGSQFAGYGATPNDAINGSRNAHFKFIRRCVHMKGPLMLFLGGWSNKVVEQPYEETAEQFDAWELAKTQNVKQLRRRCEAAK